MATTHYKIASVGGDQEQSFEQSFSSLAYSYLKNKAPRLLDFIIGPPPPRPSAAASLHRHYARPPRLFAAASHRARPVLPPQQVLGHRANRRVGRRRHESPRQRNLHRRERRRLHPDHDRQPVTDDRVHRSPAPNAFCVQTSPSAAPMNSQGACTIAEANR